MFGELGKINSANGLGDLERPATAPGAAESGGNRGNSGNPLSIYLKNIENN